MSDHPASIPDPATWAEIVNQGPPPPYPPLPPKSVPVAPPITEPPAPPLFPRDWPDESGDPEC